MLKPLVAALLIACSPLVSATESESKDVTPALSETDVQALFGDRLSKADRAENLLLLAIAFDHQSQESPTHEQPIGIPFIADVGPGYWVMLLQQEASTPRLSTLVNNALILTFLQEEGHTEEARQQASQLLLQIAASQGYWPAKVYLAERTMARWVDSMTIQIPLKQEELADIPQAEQEQVFRYLAECSQIGFAPCQFRLGFWYMQDGAKQEAAIEFLRAGVEVARRDTRYTQSRETMVDLKIALRFLADPMSGLTDEERDAYALALEEVEAMAEAGGT